MQLCLTIDWDRLQANGAQHEQAIVVDCRFIYPLTVESFRNEISKLLSNFDVCVCATTWIKKIIFDGKTASDNDFAFSTVIVLSFWSGTNI